MDSDQKMAVDESLIKKAILSSLPLTITTYSFPHEMETYIGEVISVFLKLAGQEKLKDYVFYCVRELTTNAKKANTKRVYFLEQGLDISNPDDYKKGMKNFKKNTLNNIEHFLRLQKEKGLYIRLVMQLRENIFKIEIHNNSVIIQTELIRIQKRLESSSGINDIKEAFAGVLDDSEGAGLGLVILVLMLRKLGLDENSFDIRCDNMETIARVIIPLEHIHFDNMSKLSEEIAQSIKSLPAFPENITEVQKLISAPDADMNAVAKRLSMDPALTADLLRVVNSAHYMLVKRIDNIMEAVRLVGIRGIKNLLYSYGTQKILGNETKEKKNLWEHSYKTAFYAYNLAKKFIKDPDLPDDAYVSGILHDMGKIIFSNVHPDLLNKIKNICLDRGIPVTVFEDISAGMNHAGIGALVAEKWNFPDNLVTAIRYHHDPAESPKECRDLVDCVYLANMLCEYETGNAAYEQFYKESLTKFGVTSKKQLDLLLDRFSQGFKKNV